MTDTRDLANAQAMVKTAVEIIEELMPGAGHCVINFARLNDWLNDSKAYTGDVEDTMECPHCKEISLVATRRANMYECLGCKMEVQLFVPNLHKQEKSE